MDHRQIEGKTQIIMNKPQITEGHPEKRFDQMKFHILHYLEKQLPEMDS